MDSIPWTFKLLVAQASGFLHIVGYVEDIVEYLQKAREVVSVSPLLQRDTRRCPFDADWPSWLSLMSSQMMFWTSSGGYS